MQTNILVACCGKMKNLKDFHVENGEMTLSQTLVTGEKPAKIALKMASSSSPENGGKPNNITKVTTPILKVYGQQCTN
jgi:hypothetical protein